MCVRVRVVAQLRLNLFSSFSRPFSLFLDLNVRGSLARCSLPTPHTVSAIPCALLKYQTTFFVAHTIIIFLRLPVRRPPRPAVSAKLPECKLSRRRGAHSQTLQVSLVTEMETIASDSRYLPYTVSSGGTDPTSGPPSSSRTTQMPFSFPVGDFCSTPSDPSPCAEVHSSISAPDLGRRGQAWSSLGTVG